MPLEESITGWQPILNTVLDVVVAKARMGIVGVSIGDSKEIIAFVARKLGRSIKSVEGGFAHLVSQGYVKEMDGKVKVTHEGWLAYGSWDIGKTQKSLAEWLAWTEDNGGEPLLIDWNKLSAEHTGDVAKMDAVETLNAELPWVPSTPDHQEDKNEEEVINAGAKLHWPSHPIAELFPGMTPEEKAALKEDMKQRVENGLDPLEHPILKYEEMILDGRHRDEQWVALADENACDGFFKRNLPPTEIFSPEKHGNLVAFLRAKSRNMVHRQLSASQQAAILLDAAEKYPEIKAALDAIKEENLNRQKEGRPLDAGDQRGNTAEQIGELAGAGATTVKEAQQLQKNAPAKFKEVVQGKKSTKKALREAKEEQKEQPRAKAEKANRQPVHNYKCGGTTKVITEQTKAGNISITLKSVEPPTGSTGHDLFISLNRKLAAKLHQELGETLAENPDDDGENRIG